jgi:hypothetical protein
MRTVYVSLPLFVSTNICGIDCQKKREEITGAISKLYGKVSLRK